VHSLTQELTVEVEKPSYTITLSAGGSEFTTASSVTLTGTITPPAPPGSSITIGRNGVPIFTIPVSGGSYSAPAGLKTTPPGKLRLTNPGQAVGVCGDRLSPIILWNDATPEDVANVFDAAVIPQDGGSNVATVQIAHAVQINSGILSWTGTCPGPQENLKTGVIRAGENLELGTAKCGIPCPGNGTQCTATATASVSTSVGSLSADGFWSIDIP
jgi:hypothetical protein